MPQPTYKLDNITTFMQNMHNVFLYGKIKPVHLILAKTQNKSTDTHNTMHFLDFAFKLLKSIKIHARFIFHITITKTKEPKIPTINIVLLQQSSEKTVNNTDYTYTYHINNPKNIPISLGTQLDSYIINEIFEFETEKQQIKIMSETTNKDTNEEEKNNTDTTDTGIIVAKKNDTSDDAQKSPPYINMSDLLYKNYKSDAVFTIKINLEYTKTDAKTIIINKIDIYKK